MRFLNVSFLFFSLVFSYLCFPRNAEAANNSSQFITIVNPVRISRYTIDPAESISAQYSQISKNKLPATWILTYDTLSNERGVEVLKRMDKKQEKGIFLEVTPNFAKAAGVEYHNSGFWHFANSVFLSGYTQAERIKLIDKDFEKFKEDFGYYPKSVGAWWVDSYSLNYMKEKYGITADLGLTDQLTTDGYEVWGEYWSVPFYPTKNHTGIPAASLESKLDIVEFEWAPRDPFNGYKDSKYSTQDYGVMGLKDDYFEKLVHTFADQNKNQFGQITVGLEGDFPAETYSGQFARQVEIIKKFENTGNYKVTNMGEFAKWYKEQFPQVSPAQVIEADDLLGKGGKAIWYNSPNYRIGVFYNPVSKNTKIVDLRIYQQDFQEPYFLRPNTDKELTIYMPSVVDLASDEKSVWEEEFGELQGVAGDNKELRLSFDSNKKIVLTPGEITFPRHSKIPSFVKRSKLLSFKDTNNETLTITPMQKNTVSPEGATIKALTPEASHFLKTKKTKAAVFLIITFLTFIVFLSLKFAKIRVLGLGLSFALFMAATLFGIRWYQLHQNLYWVGQSEGDALSKLNTLPSGRVLVYNHECLQCVYFSPRPPAAFVNARGYVSKWSHNIVVYNSKIFEESNLENGKEEFKKLNVNYVYLVKYPYYKEQLPFSPGDYNVEKIYGNANAEIYRVKNEKL